jgi:hypothetical protein
MCRAANRTRTQIAKRIIPVLLFTSFWIIGCETTATKAQRSADAWEEPVLSSISEGRNKADRTSRYWNSMVSLVDSMYSMSLPPTGRHPIGLIEIGSVVCGRVANDLNGLPTRGVDEDAVKTVQSLYSLLIEERDWLTDFGALNAGLKEDPQALDPSHAIGAGLGAAAKQRNHEMAVQSEIARTRALLESKYDGFSFRMPHDIN